MEAFLKYLRTKYSFCENVPTIITRENVNVGLTSNLYGGYASLIGIATRFYPECMNIVPHLLELGANIHNEDLYLCKPSVLHFLLDTGTNPCVYNDDGWEFPTSCPSVNFDIMADYGAKPPIGYKWDVLNKRHLHQMDYLKRVDTRVARCRRALLALLACCRRSEYTALRAVYKELAKWMWRMRGGGERCGPRGEKWAE